MRMTCHSARAGSVALPPHWGASPSPLSPSHLMDCPAANGQLHTNSMSAPVRRMLKNFHLAADPMVWPAKLSDAPGSFPSGARGLRPVECQKVCTSVRLHFPCLSPSNSTRCNSESPTAPSNSTWCNIRQLAAPYSSMRCSFQQLTRSHRQFYEVQFPATANSTRFNSLPGCQACCPICLSHLAPCGQEWGNGVDQVGSQPQTQEQQTPINWSGHGEHAAGHHSHLAPSAATDVQPKTGANEAHQWMRSCTPQVPLMGSSAVDPELLMCQM